MKSKAKYLFLLLFLFQGIAFSQSFDWALDGYIDSTGGGVYTNIDGSGIDMVVSGLEYDYSTNLNWVRTGINSGELKDSLVVHTHTFSFSEEVCVAFSLGNINQGKDWYDLIVLNNNPVFRDLDRVKVISDSILPDTISWNFSGDIRIYYSKITSFEITFGLGHSIPPGFLLISPIQFIDCDYYEDSIYRETPYIPIDATAEIFYPFCELLIPNVFTPNIEGPNDELYIETCYLIDLDIKIFNRWGNLVFQTSDNSVYWDGNFNNNPVAEGVYFLLITGVDEMNNNELIIVKQAIHLFRN